MASSRSEKGRGHGADAPLPTLRPLVVNYDSGARRYRTCDGWSRLCRDGDVKSCYDPATKKKEPVMSWMPDNDPVLGDPKTCDALDLVIVPRTRDLGDGFEVRRALPHGKRQMVGPFIFFDHFGPVQFVSGKGMDVRPHPHIGLATVTYLFDGSIMHRD